MAQAEGRFRPAPSARLWSAKLALLHMASRTFRYPASRASDALSFTT